MGKSYAKNSIKLVYCFTVILLYYYIARLLLLKY